MKPMLVHASDAMADSTPQESQARREGIGSRLHKFEASGGIGVQGFGFEGFRFGLR